MFCAWLVIGLFVYWYLLAYYSCSTNRLLRFDRKQFQFLFHWVSHPSFHLSLAVLVHYRFLRIFSLGGWFPRIPTASVYRGTWDIPRRLINFVYEAFTLYGRTFQTVLLSIKLPRWTPATPHPQGGNNKLQINTNYKCAPIGNWVICLLVFIGLLLLSHGQGLGWSAFARRYWRNHNPD